MSNSVRKMFSDISGEYDMLNDVLSFGRHRVWKNKFVKRIKLPVAGKHLDVATGTGDIATKIVEMYGTENEVIGVDFSESMIIKANIRKDISLENLTFKTGDALNLEFESGYFDSVSISFGIRNIPELTNAINEMARVLKPGGMLAIMEFGLPSPPFNYLYSFYSKFIIPFIGKLLSGNDIAYRYLPETIKEFPYDDKFKSIIMSTGKFSDIKIEKYEFGTVYTYYCIKKLKKG
ncbi:MAG: ubiquinone/menaquinone biosynthesis methyltransferase [Candidatus Kapaibacterium sp.]